MSVPPPSAHEEIQEVFENLFWVRGSFRMWPGGVISRNMTIVREGAELTVINAVRLDADGEAALDRLGIVKHVVRLGSFHGVDDPYYVSRYGAMLWSQPAQKHAAGLETDRPLREGGELPFSGAELLEFQRSRRPEAVIVLQREGGILIPCDSVQHFVDFTLCSLLCRAMLRVMGFRKPANIGPGFRMMAEDKKNPLRPDFERILCRPFKHLVPAHGIVLRDTAHEQVAATVERVYG